MSLIPKGKLAASFDYDAYGNLMASSGDPSTADLRYAGMFYHAASGLYLTPYRGYDPAAMRWLSRDPVGEEIGYNRYVYVNDNPLNFVDPDGRQAAVAVVVPIVLGTAILMATPTGQKNLKSIAQKVEDLCKSNDDDECDKQRQEDEEDCAANYGPVFGWTSEAYRGCISNAMIRHDMCKRGLTPIDKWTDEHVTGQPRISPRKK